MSKMAAAINFLDILKVKVLGIDATEVVGAGTNALELNKNVDGVAGHGL